MKYDNSDLSSSLKTPWLVVVGELNVDLLFQNVNQLPALEKERSAENFSMVLGSSSAILASNAQSMGLPVGFVGRTGSDPFGDFVVNALRQAEVDTSHVEVLRDTPTGATAIYTHRNRRGMITFRGAMDHLTVEDIPWDYVEQARHLHVSSLFLQQGLRPDCKKLFAGARKAGLTTSLDTGWDPEEEWRTDVLDMLDEVDVFLPNDEEARKISGRSDLEESLHLFASRDCKVVITCGKDGVLAKDGEEVIQLSATPVKPVDAVGAGDSFNAGFLNAFLQDRSFEDCLQYGILAGAYSTMSAGGTAAFREGGFQAFLEDNYPVRQ